MIIPIDLNQEGKKMIGNIGRFEAASLQKTTMVTGSKEVLEYASDRHFLDNFKEQLNNLIAEDIETSNNIESIPSAVEELQRMAK